MRAQLEAQLLSRPMGCSSNSSRSDCE